MKMHARVYGAEGPACSQSQRENRKPDVQMVSINDVHRAQLSGRGERGQQLKGMGGQRRGNVKLWENILLKVRSDRAELETKKGGCQTQGAL